MVIWITGIAGAGKTTIATRLAQQLRADGDSVVVLDGDELREVFGGRVGYSSDERHWLAHCYGRLCRLVSTQGPIVVCATISLFHEVHSWNRANIPGYVEVYVRAPREVCSSRGRQALYAAGTGEPAVGREIAIEEPRAPDVVLDNGHHADVDALVKQVLQFLQVHRG
jgi:adenylylsulfate kinase